MTARPTDGFSIHWGNVAVALILMIAAGVVLATLGWRQLWIVPALGLGLVLLGFIVSMFEDRWRIVTDHHIARGAPGTCRNCDAGLDIIAGKSNFRVRCPICGYRESGLFCE